TRFSFCNSSRISRPASSPRPSITTLPRTNPLVVCRSTSSTFPVTSWNAPISAIRAATGLLVAPTSASPILIAFETEFRTVAPRACAAVSENSVEDAAPPNPTAAARSRRSIQGPEIVRNTTRLPRSSVITAGLTGIPARCMVTCGTSGNARPIPSASTTGSPIRAAQVMGSRPFPPPISMAISAATWRPVINCRCSRSRSPSSPFSNFSRMTVVAPIPAHGMISASSGNSSKSTRGTGPKSSVACTAGSSSTCASPPPPAPSMAQPRDRARNESGSSSLFMNQSPAFALAVIRSAAPMITGPVLVSPPSMSRRQSGPCTGKLLHRQVVEVVAERTGAGDGNALLGSPHPITRERDHRDPLPVADSLGRDGIGGLRIQHRDQVRHGREYLAALQCHEVFVLQFKPDEPPRVRAELVDDHAVPHPAAPGLPLDVGYLAADQAECSYLRDECGHWVTR